MYFYTQYFLNDQKYKTEKDGIQTKQFKKKKMFQYYDFGILYSYSSKYRLNFSLFSIPSYVNLKFEFFSILRTKICKLYVYVASVQNVLSMSNKFIFPIFIVTTHNLSNSNIDVVAKLLLE